MPEVDLWAQINKAGDPPADLDKKHTATLTLPGAVKAGEPFKVTVEVGKALAHPNEPKHFIRWLDLYQDYVHLARFEFEPGRAAPVVEATLILKKSGTLQAFVNCNLHGIWESAAAVNVE